MCFNVIKSGVWKWLALLTCKLSDMSSFPIKGSRCFLNDNQETSPALLKLGNFMADLYKYKKSSLIKKSLISKRKPTLPVISLVDSGNL